MEVALRCLALALLLAAANACATSAAPALEDEAIRALLQDRVKRLPGPASIVVGLRDAHGERYFAAGWRDAQATLRADASTIYEIGSVTKIFTALLLADMIERGELRLHDAVAIHLPPQVRVPTRSGRSIRLIDLVNHRSGLPRMPGNLGSADRAEDWANYSREDLYAFLSGYELPHEVGEVEEYSNLGVVLLGQALAQRAGSSFDTLLRERISRPLQLTDTVFDLDAGQQARYATGHAEDGRPAASMQSPTLAAAGMLRSTARDMLRFLRAALAAPDAPLRAAFERMEHPDPEDPELRLSWGLEDNFGSRILWHQGRTFGFASYIGIDRAHHRAIVVLSNSKHAVTDIGFHVLNREHALQE